MKTAFILFLLLLAAFAGVGGFSVYTARARRAEAETFFRQLGENHAETAFASATEQFREDFAWNDFRQFVENFRLNQYEPNSFRIESGLSDFDWRAVKLSSVTISGHGTLRDRSKFGVRMKLRPEDQIWKVDYLYVNTRGHRPAATDGTDGAFQSKPAVQKSEPTLPLSPAPVPGVEPPKANTAHGNDFPSDPAPASPASSPP